MSDALIEGVSGAIGAITALVSTYPLLTVSTLRALDLKEGADGQTHLQGQLRFLPGPIQDVILFCREHSWRALFAGLRPAVGATAASQGIYFTCYSVLRQMAVARKLAALKQRQVQLPDGGKSVGISVGASMLVASLAGCVNVLLTNPIWVVITQMQALHKHRQGMSTVAVARQVYRDHGVAGFFKGLMPSMVMVVNPTIQYIIYESLVARALDIRKAAQKQAGSIHAGRSAAAVAAAPAKGLALSWLDIFVLSALAKIGATLVTYPLLVVKNRLQAINRHTEAEMQYTGVVDAVRRMLADEGLAGFYKGMRVKLLQTVLAAAILMTLKEEIFLAVRTVLAGRKAAAHKLH